MKLDYVLQQVLLLPSAGVFASRLYSEKSDPVTGALETRGLPCCSLGGPGTADITTGWRLVSLTQNNGQA